MRLIASILPSARRWAWCLLLLGAPVLATAQDAPPPPTKPADPAPPPAQVPTAVPPPAATEKPAEKTDKFSEMTKKAARVVESATVPVPRSGAWMQQHERYVEQAKKGDVDLLFLGDSITAGWRGAKPVWDRLYAPRHAANFGIGGDRTQHVLWRLENGEANGIKPKVVVLMIGTNNIGTNSEAEIAAGVRAVVDSLRSKFPEGKVLLLGIFPRRGKPDTDKTLTSVPPDARVGRINSQLATLDDGKAVRYLDIGRVFLDDAGQVPRSGLPDFLHLTPGSYEKWADAIEPTLAAMLEGK